MAIKPRYTAIVSSSSITFGSPTDTANSGGITPASEVQMMSINSVESADVVVMGLGDEYTLYEGRTDSSSYSEGQGYDCGLFFESSVAGWVKGLLYFRVSGQATSGQVGTLYSSSGTQLAQATFPTGSATGTWTRVDLATPYPIAANTQYCVSTHYPDGTYAVWPDNGANDWFASDRVVGLLTGVSGGSTALGGNNTYAYGSSPTFPNQTWLNPGYGVDVVFIDTEEGGGPILLEGDSLTGAGLIQDGALGTVSYSLAGDDLSGAGLIQDGATSAAYSVSGDDLTGAGLIESGAVAFSYPVAGDDLTGAGTIQSGVVTFAYALSGDDLTGAGTIQSGAIEASYSLSGDDLLGAGTIQSGIISVSYSLSGDALIGAGLIQSGETTLAPPGEILLEGDALSGAGTIQSGTVTAAYPITGPNLTGSDLIQSGDLASIAYALAGDDLTGAGLILTGTVALNRSITGDNLTGAGLIQSGAVTETTGAGVGFYDIVVRVFNDVGYKDSVKFVWEIQEELVVPDWHTLVPDRSDRIDTLDQDYAMDFYVSSNAGNLILWRLASSPAGFSINTTDGVVTATAAAGVGDHTLRVGVTNSQGESLSNFFQWEILEELVPPTWDDIPPKTTAYEDLSDDYDVEPYAHSNSGPLHTWGLVTPPVGFTIDQSGLVTAATNVTNNTTHSITVRVYNDEGSSTKSFDWTIDAPLTVSYYHEFNADLGGFTHNRLGTATWVRRGDSSTWDTIASGDPVYAGCNYNGSIYTPTTGWEGLVVEQASTNYITRSISHDNAIWDRVALVSNPPLITNSFANGNMFHEVDAFAAGEEMLMSVDAQSVTETSLGLQGWNDFDGDELVQTITGSYARFFHNPNNAGQSTRYMTVYSPTLDASMNVVHLQVEKADVRNESTSRIISDGGSITNRAKSGLVRTLASLGMTPALFNTSQAGQLKVYLDFTQVSGEQQYILAVAHSSYSDYSVIIESSAVGTGFRITQKAGGSSVAVAYNYAWTQGELIDFRWKVAPTQRLKWWVNSTAAGTNSGNVPAYGSQPTEVRVGDISGSNVPGMRVRSIRLVEGDVSDGEILAWT